MRSLKSTALAAAMAILTVASTGLAQVESYRDIKYPALRQVNIPQPKRIQLSNGMVIFLQEDKELPLIRGSATIRGGSRDESPDKTGLAGILGAAWRTGGTTSRTGDQLDELLEARAARLETGADDDSTSVSMNVLKQDFDTVFPIFTDLLRNPAFRQDKIDLAKTQANTAIARRNDDPGSILGREVAKLGYGPDSPYARQAEYSTIAAITRDDLLAFHKRFVHPNNIIIGFVGDFDSAQMERKLRQAFESWPKGPQAAKPSSPATPAKAGIYFVAKDDVTQSNIAMVHPGIERNNPDYYAAAVMNDIFSGGFSGRLMQRLRSQRGLTYGAGGGLGAGWDHPALFSATMATKSGTTLESVEALRNEIRGLTTEPVTAEELALAKESILNAFVFQMDSRAKALNQQVLLEFYGFPSDYYAKYPSMIEKVTAEDVQRVARKYIRPDQLAVLVVGKESDFEKPLSSLGTVTPIDITIPEPGAKPAASAAPGQPAAAPAATASTPAGLALARKVLEFAGGKARIDSVQSIRSTQTRNVQTPQGAMTVDVVTTVRYSDGSVRQQLTLPQGQMTTVMTPTAAFAITPMGTQDLPSSQRDAAASEVRTEVIGVLKHIDDPKYVYDVTGSETIGSVNAQILSIDAAGARTRWFVDPATGRILRTVQSSRGPMGGEVATDYSDWKSFDGLNMPTTATITRNGEKAGDVKVANVEVNPAIEANAFDKP
jgi:zinc protease